MSGGKYTHGSILMCLVCGGVKWFWKSFGESLIDSTHCSHGNLVVAGVTTLGDGKSVHQAICCILNGANLPDINGRAIIQASQEHSITHFTCALLSLEKFWVSRRVTCYKIPSFWPYTAATSLIWSLINSGLQYVYDRWFSNDNSLAQQGKNPPLSKDNRTLIQRKEEELS